MMLTDVIRLILFPALMAFAASSDLLTMTISNRLSLVLAGGFFLLTLITGMSLGAIGMHLAAAALVLTVCFGFFSMGWIGGGDAKLAAATALWFGFDFLLDYLLRKFWPDALPVCVERTPNNRSVIGKQVDDVRQSADCFHHLHNRANLLLLEPVQVVDGDEKALARLGQMLPEVLVRGLQ